LWADVVKEGIVQHRCHVPHLTETIRIDPGMKHADCQTDMCSPFALILCSLCKECIKCRSLNIFVIDLLSFTAFRATKEGILGLLYDTGDPYFHTPTKFGYIGFL
jgi:hypothetical protein